MSARVEWLDIDGSIGAWERLGFVVDDDGLLPLHGTGVRIEHAEGASGLRGWSISGVDPATDHVDGVPTDVVDAVRPVFVVHPLGATDIDHVVVVTDSLERTCAAISDVTGAPLKRVREAGEVRQGFHRVDRLIVEVVERAGLPKGPAWLWGLVINVDDLDAAVSLIGPDLVGPAKPAVQAGRSIATVRTEAGLGVALALMNPALMNPAR